MSYLRAPNTIRAGNGLQQTPTTFSNAPSGAITMTFNANVATTSSLGMVQIGSNITVDPSGVIDVTFPDSGVSTINVTQTTGPTYLVALSDNYIGVYSSNPVNINLPAGVNGREYTIKDEFGIGSGLITVVPNGVETIDGDTSAVINIPLGSITTVFRSGGIVPGWYII